MNFTSRESKLAQLPSLAAYGENNSDIFTSLKRKIFFSKNINFVSYLKYIFFYNVKPNLCSTHIWLINKFDLKCVLSIVIVDM